MFKKHNKNNIDKLNNEYILKRFLSQKHFHVLNNSLIFFNNNLNQKLNKKSIIAGTVIESGFMSWTWQNLSYTIFKNSFKKFPYSKINKLVNKEKELKIQDKTRIFFRLSETKSFICFAGAGSGKTTGVVLPTILANALSPTKPNLLITDPKGELAKSTFNFLKTQGYKVKVLNILDNENTDCFSPFTILKKEIYKMCKFPLDSSNLLNKIILKKQDIVNNVDVELKNIIYSLDEKNNYSIKDFWNQKALVAIHNIAWLIIDDLTLKFYDWKKQNPESNEEEKFKKFDEIFIKFSFQSIYSTLAEFGKDGVIKYKEFYLKKYKISIENVSSVFINEHKGLQQWKNLWRQDGNKAISEDVISNALLMLEKFNNPLLKNLTIYNTFHLDDIYGDKKEPFALFITINNSQLATLDYVSWFINYVLMKVNSFAIQNSKTKLNKPLMCIFEEIGNIPFIKFLPVTVNEGRGKNIFVSLFFQTSEQYYEKYGREGGGFMRSCAYKMLLTNAEGKIVDDFVKYAGTYKIENKKTGKFDTKARLTENYIYSLPKFKALIFQNDINVPYIAGLIPFQLFGIKNLQQLNIKIKEELFFSNKLNLIYNPLNDGSEWTLDDAIAVDFELETKKGIWDLSKTKIKKITEGIEFLISEESENSKIQYWKNAIKKINKIEQNILANKLNKTEEETISSSNEKEFINEIFDFKTKNKFISNDEKDKIKLLKLKSDFKLNKIEISEIDLNITKNLNFLLSLKTKKEILNVFHKTCNNFTDLEYVLNSSNSKFKNLIKRSIEFVNLKEEYFNFFNKKIDLNTFRIIKNYLYGMHLLFISFNKQTQKIFITKENINKFNSIFSDIRNDLIKFIFNIKNIRNLGTNPWSSKINQKIKELLQDNQTLNALFLNFDKDIVLKLKKIIC